MSSEPLIDEWMAKQGEHSWLEDVEGDAALSWVKSQNAKALKAIGQPEDFPTYKRILDILNSKEKIPHVKKIGDYAYNFWQDENHKRGIWRKTLWIDYINPGTDENWTTVLDFDKLGEDENESWVYKGNQVCNLTEGHHTNSSSYTHFTGWERCDLHS